MGLLHPLLSSRECKFLSTEFVKEIKTNLKKINKKIEPMWNGCGGGRRRGKTMDILKT